MNDLLDTRKCVYSDTISFNIFRCQEFANFIDPLSDHKQAIDHSRDEQESRIDRIVQEAREIWEERAR